MVVFVATFTTLGSTLHSRLIFGFGVLVGLLRGVGFVFGVDWGSFIDGWVGCGLSVAGLTGITTIGRPGVGVQVGIVKGVFVGYGVNEGLGVRENVTDGVPVAESGVSVVSAGS